MQVLFYNAYYKVLSKIKNKRMNCMKIKKTVLSLILPCLIYAANVDENELISFTAQKYNIDYNAQTAENQEKLKQEYEDTQKLLSAISNDIKIDTDYKVAKTLLAINVWSQKYAQSIKINDVTLRNLYEKEKPKNIESYNLYNILVSDKQKAEEILSNLESFLDKTTRLNEFKKQVNLNSKDFISSKKEGNIGWIEIEKLDKNIQEKIKNKKVNDVFISEIENIGWQVIFIEDYKPAKELTFEESKEFLSNIVRQQELIKKVQMLIK